MAMALTTDRDEKRGGSHPRSTHLLGFACCGVWTHVLLVAIASEVSTRHCSTTRKFLALLPIYFVYFVIFFFLIYVGCPGQLTRTTTIPHGPLDILQAQEQVRHRGGDRRAHRGSNPGRGRNKSHGWPQQLDPQVLFCNILIVYVLVDLFWIFIMS